MLLFTRIFFFLTLFVFVITACSYKSTEKTQNAVLLNDPGIYLLFSKQGFNFVDAAIKIQSIQLINSKHEKTMLSENLSINLASLNEIPYLVNINLAIPDDNYVYIEITLTFDHEDSIHFFHESSKSLVESSIVDGQGRTLGTEQDTFVMTIPLDHKNGFKINKHQSYALQINWNLDRLFDIHASDGQFLVELRPAAQALFIERSSTAIAYSGVYKKSGLTQLAYIPDLSSHTITISVDNNISKKLTGIKPEFYIRGKANLLIDNNITLKTTDIRTFSNTETYYKGVILEKDNNNAKLFASKLNHADYMTKNKRKITVMNAAIPDSPVRSITEFLSPTSSSKNILKGSTEVPLEPPTHQFLIEYNEELHQTLRNAENNPQQTGIWSAVFMIDGITLADSALYRMHNMPDNLHDGIYEIEGHYLSNCSLTETDDCFDVQVNHAAEVSQQADTLGHSRLWWDFNYYEEGLKEWLAEATLKDFEKQDILEKNADSSFLVTYDGSAIIISGEAINMLDISNDSFLPCCRTITFSGYHPKESEPLFTIEQIDAHTTGESASSSEQVIYIYSQSELAAWFSQFSKPVYLETLDLSATPKKEQHCHFDINGGYIRMLTDPTTRDNFREKFLGGNFTTKQKGLSTAAFATAWGAIGIGAIAAIAGVTALIKKFKNKNKGNYSKLASSMEAELSKGFESMKNTGLQDSTDKKIKMKTNPVVPSNLPDTNKSKTSILDTFKKTRR